MDFERIREFKVMAKFKNLSEAARELNTTQSTLSKHLASMEKELKAPLFKRDSVPMELTKQGMAFLQEACLVTSRLTHLRKEIDQLNRSSDITEIQVGGLLNTRATFLLNDDIKSIGTQNALVRYCQLVNLTSMSLLKNNYADIVIDCHLGGPDSRSGIISIKLFKDPALCIMEKTHPLADHSSLRYSDLKGETFATVNNGVDSNIMKHLTGACSRHGYSEGLHFDYQLLECGTYSNLLLEGLEGKVFVLPSSTKMFLPLFTLERYALIPIDDEDLCFDIRGYYLQDADKKLENILQGFSKFALSRSNS